MLAWFNNAAEVKRLRAEVQRQAAVIEDLTQRLGLAAGDVNAYGVSDAERALVAQGEPIKAIKAYRERTGAGLLAGKRAIDSVS
ncbi:hypothetical protein [Corynebacterium sp. SA-MJD20WY100]|uniref:hypothetical protein n=1 Tax=Corynebacterium sp. SA-MJD20WY100 TaxID=3142969 RepID=UPI0032216891